MYVTCILILINYGIILWFSQKFRLRINYIGREHVLEKEGEGRHIERGGEGRERGKKRERELQIPADTKDPGESNIFSKSDEQ